jgi:hypothetical protein
MRIIMPPRFARCRHREGKYSPCPAPNRIGHDAPMPDHPHTIDRWDDATGENLIEQIAAVGDYLG